MRIIDGTQLVSCMVLAIDFKMVVCSDDSSAIFSNKVSIRPSVKAIIASLLAKISSFASVIVFSFALVTCVALPFPRFAQPLSAWFERSAATLHRKAYRALASVLACCLLGSCDQCLVRKFSAIDTSEQVIHAVGNGQLAPIKPPRHFLNVFVQMFRRNPVVNADDLAFQQRPNRLNRVGISVASAPFAFRVVHDFMLWEAFKRYVSRMCVGYQHFGARETVSWIKHCSSNCDATSRTRATTFPLRSTAPATGVFPLWPPPVPLRRPCLLMDLPPT